ncbi:extracellular solute-binding protein [Extibacter muris]|uniref:extracellular solute-binding protein n=1 Tax=Extibacter muris TaxID=1796622 RepID=UPI001D0778FB|nr:extracellular solute-binding protein [Extibacter muris]MCB6202803.1 extracellular solute-binding protein [Extibacter muris]MCQ4664799.1 extracellular solute-binding protein [Extibacter muris]MCQ4694088.1 extracellular solute-binding protein [Extibacter muris]
MKVKRMIAILFAVSLLTTGAAGCSAKKDGDGKKEAMGRYVEKQVELPFKEDEEAATLTEDGGKGAVLYSRNKEDGTYKAYRYDGGKFKEEDASWLNSAIGAGGTLSKAVKGEDGNLYAFYGDENAMVHVIRKDGGSSQEIEIPDLAVKDGNGIYPFIGGMRVDKEGNIFLAFPVNGEVVMYDKDTGGKIRSFQGNQFSGLLSMPMDVRDNKILLAGADGSGLVCYDTGSGEVKEETEYADMDVDGILRLGDSDDCILADSKGLHHLTMGGSMSEDLVDGGTSAFGIPQTNIMDLAQIGKGDYTMLQSVQETSGRSTYVMYRYVYDKKAKAKPSRTLRVYGLEESAAVRQAIAKYQQKHPDVGIEYKTGNAGEGTGTKADSIRALNTELLSGSGADVIMLDGLPADSYIEKGILADISGVLNEAGKESDLSDNIIKPYKKDGSIYQIPTRYGIPLLIGGGNAAEAFESADALVDYMKDHAWDDVMDQVDKESLMKLMLNMYYKDIVDKNKQIDTKLLAQLMETVGKAEDNEEGSVTSISTWGSDEGMTESDWDVGKFGSFDKKDTLSSKEMKGIQGMMIPYHYLRREGASPSDVNGIFVPHDIAGINKATRNKELAEDFVRMLLSEEVQSMDVENGFPVNEQAMEAWIQSVEETPDEEEGGISVAVGKASSDGGEGEVTGQEVITFPHQSEVKSLAEIGKKLIVPVQKDDIIGEMILDGAKTYFDGSRSAEEAAEDIAEKADTYLAE